MFRRHRQLQLQRRRADDDDADDDGDDAVAPQDLRCHPGADLGSYPGLAAMAATLGPSPIRP